MGVKGVEAEVERPPGGSDATPAAQNVGAQREV